MMVGASNIFVQFITFCGVGGFNTALSLTIILLLSEIFQVHYVLANMVGYGAGLISGFIMHKHFTFRAQQQDQPGTLPAARQFVRFLSVFAIGYSAQLFVLMALVQTGRMDNMPAQITAWIVYILISFAGNKFFTFAGLRKKNRNGNQHE